jgi:phosphate/sulfate permease
MDKKIKKLMLSNIIFYLNNLIMIIFMHNPEFKEIAAVWFFSPFVVILFTTVMFESLNRKMNNQLKQLSVIDFLLRCTILLINFLGVSGIIYLTFNHLILYAKEQSILRDKSPNEKEEIRSIYKSTFFVGCSYALILLLIGGGIFAFSFWGEQYRLLIIMIASLLVGVYFYLTSKKLTLFFKDINQRKKISLRDNLTFIVGLSIIYILQGYIHIGTGTFNFLGVFFATIFFIPTIKTNHLIRDTFYKINKKYHNR